MTLAGVIFDLDGTLVDSGLDFDAIRRDMGLPSRQPILEAMAAMPSGPDKQRCLAILREHELRGAETARLMPGADRFLAELSARRLKSGVLTRNSRESTDIVLARLNLQFTTVLTRDDVSPKPDPAGLLSICRRWQVAVAQVLFVGDYLFDLQAGRDAGIRTVLYAPNGTPAYADQADAVVRSFDEAIGLLHGDE